MGDSNHNTQPIAQANSAGNLDPHMQDDGASARLTLPLAIRIIAIVHLMIVVGATVFLAIFSLVFTVNVATDQSTFPVPREMAIVMMIFGWFTTCILLCLLIGCIANLRKPTMTNETIVA